MRKVRDRIARARIYNQVRNGGPPMLEPRIHMLMRASWIVRLSRKYGAGYQWPKSPPYVEFARRRAGCQQAASTPYR